EDAAVAAALAVAFHLRRRRPLDVQLRAAEALRGMDAAAPWRDGENAVRDLPGRRSVALVAGPLRQVLAIEEDGRVGRRRPRRCAWRDDRRLFRGVRHLTCHALVRRSRGRGGLLLSAGGADEQQGARDCGQAVAYE